MYDKDRAGACRGDFGRLASDQHSAKSAAAVRRHDDKVAPRALGLFEDAIGGLVVADVPRLAPDPRRFGLFRGLCQDLFACLAAFS